MCVQRISPVTKPIPVVNEPADVTKKFRGELENCYFCQTPTSSWHKESNTPVCSRCAEHFKKLPAPMTEIPLTDQEAQTLALRLADALFALGSNCGPTPVQRIQFLGGTWPDNEIDQGGMCHQALVDFFKKTLLARTGRRKTNE